MFFFSGFGPVFPYLIYLSLIWICILFGFGHKFRDFIHPQSIKVHVTYVKEKSQSIENSTIDPFGQFSPSKNISKKKEPVTHLKCRVFYLSVSSLRYFLTNDHIPRVQFIPQFTRRGPPMS
jgi:hypothetical protein